LKAVGQLWLNGVNFDWNSYYSNQNRIKLYNAPTYAFEKKISWVHPPKEAKSEVSLKIPEDCNINQLETTVMRKTELIQKLRLIVENASGIETDGMSPEYTFLEMGLDSLLLTQLALTLKREFQLPITFRKLTEEYGSLSLLAEYLAENLVPDALPQATQTVIAPTDSNNNGSAMGLISQQIQLLAQQIAMLQNENNVPTSNAVLPNV